MTQKAYTQAATELAQKAKAAQEKRNTRTLYTKTPEPERPLYVPLPSAPGFRHF